MTTLVKTEPIDLVLSGSGTLLPAHIGAWAGLHITGRRPMRVAGTSGGGIVAAAIAYGLRPMDALVMARKFLRPSLLDPSLWFFDRFGLHKWERVRALLDETFRGLRLGDALIPLSVFAFDLETQTTVSLNSQSHPSLSVADALATTSAIPVFAKARRLSGMRGLFVDGGASMNFALGYFDDEPSRRTVGIRIRAQTRRRKVGSIGDFVGALAGAWMDAANRSYVSSKRWANVIEIVTNANALDFALGDSEIQALHDEGHAAALAWSKTAPPI